MQSWLRRHNKWIKDYDSGLVGGEGEVGLRHLCNTIAFGIGKIKIISNYGGGYGVGI